MQICAVDTRARTHTRIQTYKSDANRFSNNTPEFNSRKCPARCDLAMIYNTIFLEMITLPALLTLAVSHVGVWLHERFDVASAKYYVIFASKTGLKKTTSKNDCVSQVTNYVLFTGSFMLDKRSEKKIRFQRSRNIRDKRADERKNNLYRISLNYFVGNLNKYTIYMRIFKTLLKATRNSAWNKVS